MLDLTNTPENTQFQPLPEDNYFIIVDESQINETKDGTGEYISVKFRVLAGQYEGRKIFHSFNIKNKTTKAVEIGLSQLKTFMKCSGAKNYVLNSPLDLVGMRCTAHIKIRTDETYGSKNVVSYFKPTDTTTTQTKPTTQTKSSSLF